MSEKINPLTQRDNPDDPHFNYTATDISNLAKQKEGLKNFEMKMEEFCSSLNRQSF
jgi:hypothetical protein